MSSQILPPSANEYNIEKYEKRLYKLDFQTKIKLDMEVLAIQKSALDGMKNELKALLELTENATQKYTPIFKEEQWLDNQEVCLMMNITKRTLQTYKSKGLLAYSKLNRKNYYKRSDVQALLEAGQPDNTTENGFIHE
ncbi:helix-turn-helix domain-containing protein [Elizabethkingia sp. HX WYD]|nr:helix-turn-helix domain-containing protein [Elizabethkingia sp. HX WYD]